MPTEDQPANSQQVRSPSARRWVWLVGILLAMASAFTIFVVHDDDRAAATFPSGMARLPSSSSTTIEVKSELATRLTEILAIRGRAYQKRDLEMLKRIYTVDCPCLKSDSNAIRELIKEKYVWVGGEASIQVRKMEKVSDRMWIITADFVSAPLRIETESGQLVRTEPKGRDRFQFVLARPTGSAQWLLGRASAYESG